MSGVYNGNSRQKDIARDAFYLPILDRSRQIHIIIAGPEPANGDARYLISRGVPRIFVIACDRNPKARSAAQELGVMLAPDSHSDDLEKTVDYTLALWGKMRIASINGDFCGHIETVAPIIKRLQAKVNKGTKVSATFVRGRDKFKSDTQRQEYWKDTVGDYKNWFAYQSNKAGSRGSPMCMVW